jgi:signal transduction histidine kinase
MAIILGVMVTRSISQPLARLDLGTQALARQEFDYRIEDSGHDELSHLSQVFNHTAAQLAELYHDLEQVAWQRTLELQESTEELHHRYLQLETTIGVGQRAISILDLDTLLYQVVELIKDRYDYYYVGVFLLDETKQYITARAGTGEAGKLLSETGFRLKVGEEGIIGWVAKHRQPLRVDDVSQNSHYVKVDIIPDTRSECALPLAMGEKVLGVLDLQSDRVQAFPMEDTPVLQSLADQLAIALQNARLYQREKARRHLAETLNNITRALSGTLNLGKVLNLILEHLASLVPYERAAVLLQDQTNLEVVAARGFPETIDPLQIRISSENDEDNIFQEIYHTQQPLIITDIREYPGWQYIIGLPEARAWLGVPLILSNQVIGMLSLAHEIPNAYDKDQVELAVTFAGQAAIAIENARLYEQIIRFNQYLEEVVRERTEALQITNKQLEHLDQTKSDFIHIAAHELRTPLTVLRGYSQILLKDPAIEQNELHREMITSIHSGAMRLHEIVNSLLDVTKIDSRALQIYPEPLAISPLIEKICQKFNKSFTQRQQTFEVRDINTLPTIEADPDALHKVFYHLVGNAIKYTPDGGKIRVVGRPLTNGQHPEPIGIEIIISDDGIGIDPEFHELIFTKFYQTGELALHSTSQVNFKGAGPGLGLAIVKGIVEAHQGQVWVESEQHDEKKLPGSDFHVVLPLRQDKFASQ